MHTWNETKALYRLLDEPDVTFVALMQPHFQQTREQATSAAVVLLVQDTTDIDLSHRHKISGVGQIGNERGRGFFVQTVLAVHPQTREVLGCMAQEPFVRIPAHAGEQRYQRRKREERLFLMNSIVHLAPILTTLRLVRRSIGTASVTEISYP
jgi:hypothetical protein